jgi:CHAD domain-containing protein
MEVTLHKSESATAGLLRCLRVTISACQARLRGPAVTDADIHTVRKNLKRARAILRLLRPSLTKQRFRTLDGNLRDISRSWSGLRDASVQRDTLLDVKVAADNPAIDADVEWLTEEAPATVPDGQRQERAASSLATLSRLQRRIRAWQLPRADRSILGDALRKTYRAGRRAGRSAARLNQDEDFHHWRKQSKYLYQQLRTLASDSASRLVVFIDGLEQLSELLGKEHDIGVLQAALVGSASLAGLPDEGRRLLRWLAEERATLRARAQALGSELYAARPRDFEVDLEKLRQRN